MEDIIGKKFGRLTVLEVFSENGRKKSKCQCECGNKTVVRIDLLKSNHTKSCGCLHKEISSKILKRRNNKGINEIEEKEDYIVMKIKHKGKIYDCLIDKDDYDKVKKYRWYIMNIGYVAADIPGKKSFRMHRLITNYNGDLVVDHFNRNKLDNRKCNLRIISQKDNMKNTSSKGYSWNKNSKKWIVEICCEGTRHYLGSFKLEEEAKEARRQAEIKYFGEFRYKD